MSKSIPALLTALFLVGMAIWLTQPAIQSSTSSDAPLFKELRSNALKINRIEIKDANGMLFSGMKKEGKWVAVHFFDYPVNERALSKWLQQLVRATQAHPRTTSVEHHVYLGVSGIEDINANAVKATFYVNDSEVLSILMGHKTQRLTASSSVSSMTDVLDSEPFPAEHRNTQVKGAYLRRSHENQVWFIRDELSLPYHSQDWLRQPILPVTADAISSLRKLGEEGWQIAKDEEGKWELVSHPHQALAYEGVLENVIQQFIGLRFDRILKRDTSAGVNKEKVKNPERIESTKRRESPEKTRSTERVVPDMPQAMRFVLTLHDGRQVETMIRQGEEGMFQLRHTKTLVSAESGFVYQVTPFAIQPFTQSVDILLRE